MLRLRVPATSGLKVDVVPSPVWETVASLAVLGRRRRGAGAFLRWAREAEGRVPPDLVADLWRTLSAMSPPPPRWEPVPDFVASFGDTALAESLQAYWEAALAPSWEGLRSVLQDERDRRAGLVRSRGWSAAFRHAEGRMQWRPPVLATPHQEEIRLPVRGGVVRLVPTVFGGAWALFTALPHGVVSLSYPVPGAAMLALRSPDRPAVAPRGTDKDPLAIVVGTRRAALLRVLRSPATTSALADTLGIAPSTTSEHLQHLLDAQVVRKRRVGYEVHYELDRAGYALLEVFP